MGAKVNKGFTSLRFPDYLGTDEAPAYIRFEPTEIDFGKFKNTAPTGASLFTSGKVDSAKNKVYDKIKGAIKDKVKDKIKKKAQKILGGKLSIGGIELDFTKDKDLYNTQGSINLYLPEGIGSQVGFEYDGSASGVGVGKALGEAAANALSGNISAADAAAAGGKIATGFVSQVLQTLANTNAGRVATALGGGVVANNVNFQLFKGVQYRSFSYQFTLIAKNSKEAIEIKKICDKFLYYGLPTRNQVEQSEGEGEKGIFHFYDIPAMWKIDYMYKDAVMKYHQQPSTYCVLSNIDVQYPNNQVYTDSAPLSVNLTLSFTEIEPLYRSSGDEESGEESKEETKK